MTPEQIRKIIAYFHTLFPENLTGEHLLLKAGVWFKTFKDTDPLAMQRAVALVTLQVNRFPFPSDIQHALQTIQAVQAILTAEQNQGEQA